MSAVVAALTSVNDRSEVIGRAFLVCWLIYFAYKFMGKVVGWVFTLTPPTIHVDMTKEEKEDLLTGYPKFDTSRLLGESKKVFLWDPSTLDYFGEIDAMDTKAVNETVERSRVAQKEWRKFPFHKRRLLMRTMLKYITEHQEECARVAVRESGKTLLDAIIGEVLVTCEKLTWLIDSGEQYLVDEPRDTGRMMMMKKVWRQPRKVQMKKKSQKMNLYCFNFFCFFN